MKQPWRESYGDEHFVPKLERVMADRENTLRDAIVDAVMTGEDAKFWVWGSKDFHDNEQYLKTNEILHRYMMQLANPPEEIRDWPQEERDKSALSDLREEMRKFAGEYADGLIEFHWDHLERLEDEYL